MKPPISYFGAKVQLAERIVALFPPHTGYVEPYGGSLAVLFAKAPVKLEVVNDLDRRLMTFWRVLRDQPAALQHLADYTPHSRAELEAAMLLDEARDDLDLAHRVWIMLTQGRSRTLRRTGWRFFTDPTDGSNTSFTGYMQAYRDRLAPAAARLRNVTLECRPALDVIAQYGRHSGTLLYVDPPYEHSTRSASRYSHEARRSDHEELAEALHAVTGPVVLSGYHSPVYDSLYAGWHLIEFPAFTGNAKAGNNRRREVLWANRDLDPALIPLTAGGGCSLVKADLALAA